LKWQELTQLAAEILRHRTDWAVNLKGTKAEALTEIIRVGTSAGGNRAKAVIAWNPQTHEVRSGQVAAPPGFEPWILKFDGVNDARSAIRKALAESSMPITGWPWRRGSR
jgi:serine/threonine-protein kinase HipA